MKLQPFLFLVSALLAFQFMPAQQIPENSFAFGLEPSLSRYSMPQNAAVEGDFKQSTMNVGFQFNYQKNYSDFFSLRSGLGFIYQLPFVILRNYSSLGSNEKTIHFSQISWHSINGFLAPMLYHRDKNFSVFTGCEFGAGHYLYRGSGEYRFYKTDGSSSGYETSYKRDSWGYHIAPRVGVSFPLANNTSEIEISISSILRTFEFSSFDTEIYTNVGFQMAYRYNLTR